VNSRFKTHTLKPASGPAAGILAVLITSVLHAGIMGGLVMLGKGGPAGKAEAVNTKDEKLIPVSLMVLPRIEKRGQKSV